MKSCGASDSEVLSHLRAHTAELPAMIDGAVLRELKRDGAGSSVFAYLATVAALDIGPTAESAAPSGEAGAEGAQEVAAYGSGDVVPDAPPSVYPGDAARPAYGVPPRGGLRAHGVPRLRHPGPFARDRRLGPPPAPRLPRVIGRPEGPHRLPSPVARRTRVGDNPQARRNDPLNGASHGNQEDER